MKPGSGKHTLILQIAFLFVSLVLISGCWIPLPEDTAIVVEVFDARGNPVDGVVLLLDGSETIITGSQTDPGLVFKSLNVEGDHTIQLDTASLIDPQGGVGWTPLASQISGEVLPLSFENRPFTGGSDVLIVPVNKGEITVATIYLDDILKSPMDNQWLTDGSNPSPYRPDNNTDEFRDNPEPVFWWRQDPSLGITVSYTFQLWEDDDTDTRFPLGVIDHVQYSTAMDSSNIGYVQPDWQVPLAGIQRAETVGVNTVALWASQASDSSNPIDYDLYYAPTTQWVGTDLEKNPVVRDIIPEGALDGVARKFNLGTGSTNPGLLLKNGIEYTFALKARDGASNLDTTGSTSTRKATPGSSASSFGAVTNLSAVADSTIGGQIDLTFLCNHGDGLRVYAAPSLTFNKYPFDSRFIRDTLNCNSTPETYSLANLVNNVAYSIGIEPFDASGNVGTASSIVVATPSGASSIDTTAPSAPTISATPDGNGQITLNLSAVTDSNSVFRRVYWSPVSFTSSDEAMAYTDLAASTPGSLILSDIPNDIPFNYIVRAIDSFGNSARAATQVTLNELDTTGPTWASDDPGFFGTISYSVASTIWSLGNTWGYGSAAGGFALGRDPGQGQGEYIWRIIQKNPVRGIARTTKLGAFYTWSGYYYASTESGSLNMSSPSANADHRDVFSFIEGASNVLSADVMGTPFDSTDAGGYKQRTAAQHTTSLAAGSGTTNQLTILYNTDEDGQAIVSQISSPTAGFAGILRIFCANKQRPLPTPEPHLQGKEFQISYFDASLGLVNFPPPTFGGSGIFFFGTLDEPDYQDPLW